MYGVIKLTGISGSHTVSILPTGIGKICIGIWTVKVCYFYNGISLCNISFLHTHTHDSNTLFGFIVLFLSLVVPDIHTF